MEHALNLSFNPAGRAATRAVFHTGSQDGRTGISIELDLPMESHTQTLAELQIQVLRKAEAFLQELRLHIEASAAAAKPQP